MYFIYMIYIIYFYLLYIIYTLYICYLDPIAKHTRKCAESGGSELRSKVYRQPLKGLSTAGHWQFDAWHTFSEGTRTGHLYIQYIPCGYD